MRFLLPTLCMGCGLLWVDEERGSSGPSPALVEVAEAREGVLDDEWSLPAEVRAFERSVLAAAASGPITELALREGASVQRGDLLLAVDPQPAAARLAVATSEAREAEVSAGRAEREVERLSRVAEGVLSASELDLARTEAESLRARVGRLQAAAREARVLLDRHRLRAPFDGEVVALLASVGDWVEPGQPVLELVNLGALDLRVDAPRALARQLSKGDRARLRFGSERADAEVVGIASSLERTSRTAVVRLEPLEPVPEWIVPGLSVTVDFDVVRRDEEAARIPRDALVLGAAGTRVVKVVDGKAQSVQVDVVATAGDDALVRPLAPGDVVVTRGNERLRTGQAVEIDRRREEG
ncbi:MAG: efflux RND transporter periplasmic adaptor subunit [Deltaproteobacteria bacterium]|nr:MAG: efflux RND transporter periplasmic adaptor subunit [Deltaproteobacteria bacterium]